MLRLYDNFQHDMLAADTVYSDTKEQQQGIQDTTNATGLLCDYRVSLHAKTAMIICFSKK